MAHSVANPHHALMLSPLLHLFSAIRAILKHQRVRICVIIYQFLAYPKATTRTFKHPLVYHYGHPLALIIFLFVSKTRRIIRVTTALYRKIAVSFLAILAIAVDILAIIAHPVTPL
jgi:hypothetical protein